MLMVLPDFVGGSLSTLGYRHPKVVTAIRSRWKAASLFHLYWFEPGAGPGAGIVEWA